MNRYHWFREPGRGCAVLKLYTTNTVQFGGLTGVNHTMSETQQQTSADESDSNTDCGDDVTGKAGCRETVDPKTREKVLDRDDHRCQTCGRRGPSEGGLASLHIHHIERNPDGRGEHELSNLTTMCRACHSWMHQMSRDDEAPVELTDEDLEVLLPQDVEILQFLERNGPARTGEIRSELTADLSLSSVRERLWTLMGLDNRVDGRTEQVLDQDLDTGEWGLPEQTEKSSRGHIPDDPQLLILRAEDEQVRQALERGIQRDTVQEVFNLSRRSTFHKEKRAYAYDFPLDAIYRGNRGTMSSDDEDEKSGDEALTESEDGGSTEIWRRTNASSSDSEVEIAASNASDRDPIDRDVREQLEDAISTLKAISNPG